MKLKLIISMLILWLGCSSLWAAISEVKVGGVANEQCFQHAWSHQPVDAVSFPFNVTQHNFLMIAVGQGCDLSSRPPQDCLAPTVTDSLGNTFVEQDAYDPTHLMGTFFYWTCNNVASGPDTVTVTSNIRGSDPPHFPLSEWMIHIKEYTGNVSASINACQDSPNMPGPNSGQGQCFSGRIDPMTTGAMPGSQNPANFRTTTNVFLYAFMYDRISEHTYTITGSPTPPDYNHQVHAPSFLNSTSTGQTMAITDSLIANANAPPYSWTYTISGGTGLTPFEGGCILAFDSAANQFQATAKKKGLLF